MKQYEEIVALKRKNAELLLENEELRNGISFIVADSLGDDTSVDWIRIQLNRLLTEAKEK